MPRTKPPAALEARTDRDLAVYEKTWAEFRILEWAYHDVIEAEFLGHRVADLLSRALCDAWRVIEPLLTAEIGRRRRPRRARPQPGRFKPTEYL